jgi:hypothetical protein
MGDALRLGWRRLNPTVREASSGDSPEDRVEGTGDHEISPQVEREDVMPTIDEVDTTADRLEALLLRYGVSISAGSRLERGLLFARHVLHVRREEAEIEDGDDRPRWREMHGLFDLAQRLLYAESKHPAKFGALVPWLRLFASTRGQLAQTAPTEPGDQDSDKMFELLVALCLLPRIGRLFAGSRSW